jgi:hypothetical protein
MCQAAIELATLNGARKFRHRAMDSLERIEVISRRSFNYFIFSAFFVSMASGCTTMHLLPATDTQSIRSELAIGETVRIIRKDASETTFEIEGISDDGISGGAELVAYSDIEEVRVRRSSTPKNIGLVAGIVLVVAGLAGSDTSGLLPQAPQ